MITAEATQPECTPEQGAQWQHGFSDGYKAGRGDARSGGVPRIALVTTPPELPGECGAQYAARYCGIAWQIGYSHAWRFEAARR